MQMSGEDWTNVRALCSVMWSTGQKWMLMLLHKNVSLEKVGEANQMVSFWEGCLCYLQISLVISESVTFVVAVMSIGCRSSEDGSPQRFVAARPAVRPAHWVDRPDSSQNC